MPFRFSRRISILPGVRVNLGKRGASLSVGPRGASVTMGRGGVHGNVGLPGTGLSYRTRLDQPSRASRPAAPSLPPRLIATIEHGTLLFSDGDGLPLDPMLYAAAKRAMKDELRDLLERAAAQQNAGSDALGQLHHDIPATIAPTPPRSGKPMPGSYATHQDYMQALMTWRAAAANHGPDTEAVETALLDRLGALEWPRETNIAIELRDDRLLLDIDLPEIEDMPQTRSAPSHAQLMLIEKSMTRKYIAATYLAHVCAIVVRLIGHGFAASASIASVGVSGYTQRNGTIGQIEDDYVIVADIDRTGWSVVDLTRMADIDPENLLRRLGGRFEVNAQGVLKTQRPLN